MNRHVLISAGLAILFVVVALMSFQRGDTWMTVAFALGGLAFAGRAFTAARPPSRHD